MRQFRRRRATYNPVTPPQQKSLLPPEVREKLPPWRSTAEQEDPEASFKFFMPGTDWTWYVVEYDGADTCFGLVSGFEVEAGYFSLSELENVYNDLKKDGTLARVQQQGKLIGPVERDLHFKPTRLSELRRLHGRGFSPDEPSP